MYKALVMVCCVGLVVSGCAPTRYSMREIREYDQAVSMAEEKGMDTTVMRQKLVEMLMSYAEQPGLDGYEKAARDASRAAQAQAINGAMAVYQQGQLIDNSRPMPMSFGEWQRGF